jgi:RES domain-containing protein
MRVYRVAYRLRAKTPLDGEGSFLYGGRWSSAGTRMAYTSSTLALAMLEFLAHVDFEDFDPDTPPRLVYVTTEVADDALLTLEQLGAALPRGWDRLPAPAADAELGDAWVVGARSLGLVVPSVQMPRDVPERNVLINPQHPRFRELKPAVADLLYDRRLIERG